MENKFPSWHTFDLSWLSNYLWIICPGLLLFWYKPPTNNSPLTPSFSYLCSLWWGSNSRRAGSRVSSNNGLEGNLGPFKVKYQIPSTSAHPLPRRGALTKTRQPFSHPATWGQKGPSWRSHLPPRMHPLLHSCEARAGQRDSSANALRQPLGLWAQNKDPSRMDRWTRAVKGPDISGLTGWREVSVGNP